VYFVFLRGVKFYNFEFLQKTFLEIILPSWRQSKASKLSHRSISLRNLNTNPKKLKKKTLITETIVMFSEQYPEKRAGQNRDSRPLNLSLTHLEAS
jgi:hypothetical protein